MTTDHLNTTIEEWISDALPLWLEKGWDAKNGGFYESLDLQGLPIVDENRRIRVQFRQLFSASYAAHFGLWDGAKENADRTFKFTRDELWQCDGKAGFPHILDPENNVVNDLRDTYDHMFALLSLGWYNRIEKSDEVQNFIDDILTFLDGPLRANKGGWKEGLPNSLPRRQNPHMHGIEMFMALAEGTGDMKYLARAGECFGYFTSIFHDSSTHTVREFFDENWQPAPSGFDEVEPGHMVEWVWLLQKFQSLSGAPCSAIMESLYKKARNIGTAPNSIFLLDVTSPTGAVLKPSMRCWPQTELVKSSIALYRENSSSENQQEMEKATQALLDGYLSPAISGAWIDKLDIDGKPSVDRMPASTLYHILVALNEFRLYA